MRQGVASWVLKGFLIIIALSFVSWGVGDMFRGSADPVVASVGGQDIHARQLVEQVNQQVERLSRATGGQVDFETARELGVIDQTLQQMVARALLTEEANDFGLAVPDSTITEAIRSNPAFKNDLGTFDRQMFQAVLQRNGLTEAAYVASLRNDIAQRQLIGSVVSGMILPDALTKTFYGHREEKRVIDAVIVTANDVDEVAEPDDAAIQDYYDNHEDQFTAPEYRALTYVTITPADLMSSVEVTDAEVKDLYDARIDSFRQPEQRIVDHLFFSDEETAKAAYDRLLRGEDLLKVAADISELGADDVSLGSITRSELPDEAAEPVFALKNGGITVPVKTAFGWNIYRVNSIQPEHVQTLDEVRAVLHDEVARERALDVMVELGNTLEDQLAAGSTLEEAASSLDLEAVKIEAVDSRGLDRKGDPVDVLPKISGFLDTAFETPVGLESPLTESDSRDAMYVVQVDDVIDPALRPLDEVRDDVVASVKEEMRVARAGEIAGEIATAAREGGDLSAAASAHGLTVRTTQAFTRQGTGLDLSLSQEAIDAIFRHPKGAVTDAIKAGATSYVVAKTTDVEVPAYSDSEPAGATVRNELAGSFEQDLLGAFEKALRDRYDVAINRENIDKVF